MMPAAMADKGWQREFEDPIRKPPPYRIGALLWRLFR